MRAPPRLLPEMSAPDLDLARQFQRAAEAAMRTGEFEPLVALLAPDVECVTPLHSVQGPDALTEELRRARPSERFELEFENGDWKLLGRRSVSVRDTGALPVDGVRRSVLQPGSQLRADDPRRDGQPLRDAVSPAESFHPPRMTRPRAARVEAGPVEREERQDALAAVERTGGGRGRDRARARLCGAAVRLEALGGRGRRRRSAPAQPLPAQLLARRRPVRGSLRSAAASTARPAAARSSERDL